MYLLMMALLAWAIWRARRRLPDVAPLTEAPAADDLLCKLLNSWSALIMIGLFVLAGGSFLVDRQLARAEDPHALRVRITGSEWWWQVEYLDPDPSKQLVTANELHLPVGRATRVELRSNDVIHSFWVPSLNGKTDLIPGRSNYQTITPRRTGQWRGQCAEFCGLEHARMAMDVTVEDAAAFERWKAAQLAPARTPATAVEQQGQHVFLTSTCASCHTIAGTDAGGKVGPDLTHMASRRTLAASTLPTEPQALAQWIRDPHARKPGTNMPATDLPADQLTALVTYLMSLR
ncbi:cytochrome c oxidase subunit II [Dyella sp. 2RAB6]|uniref:cytochrome c oxidase subunit II n=1 Tax=Dyella sp. 2RAB6 TaxID=3232992 RepID=UPI003F913869